MKKNIPFLLTALLLSAPALLHAQSDPGTRVILENDRIKITEYTSQPGQDVCGIGNHKHGNHATILLTDAKVKEIQADGTEVIETYLADKHQYTASQNGKNETVDIDGAFWAKAATHRVTNIGNNVLKFYIIETK